MQILQIVDEDIESPFHHEHNEANEQEQVVSRGGTQFKFGIESTANRSFDNALVMPVDTMQSH